MSVLSRSIPVVHIDEHVVTLVTAIGSENLWTAPWESVERLPLLPGATLADDVVVVPEQWARTKRQLVRNTRTINFNRALPEGMHRDTLESEKIIRRAKRIAAMLLVTPVIFPSGYIRSPSKPITWVQECESIVMAIAWVLTNTAAVAEVSSCPDGSAIFSRLTKSTFDRLCQADGYSGFWKHGARKLAALAHMGLVDDWPDFDLGSRLEPRRRNTQVPITTAPEMKRWLPFSDEFTSVIGRSALWMTEELGTELIDCLKVSLGISTELNFGDYRKEQERAISQWYASTKYKLRGKTFPVVLHVAGVAMDRMPPPGWRELRIALSLLQTAHLVIVAIATGARESELMGLRRDCLRTVGAQELLIGHTFKLSDAADGERRDWPLPTIAVTALMQQKRLAELLAPGKDHLWLSFSIGKNARGLRDIRKFYDVLSRYCDAVVVDGKSLRWYCKDGNPHPHRFRKTVARLAALSMVGATSIMFDILGHRDPEMTLNYLLSDPDLQDEIRKIATEANVALSRAALQCPEDNGGPASKAVSDFARRLAARSGNQDLQVSDLAEAAEILSLSGQVTIVKPGVLCTKTIGQPGACTRKGGAPDIGKCYAGCHHRLELAAAKNDCITSIEYILGQIPSPRSEMMRAWWQCQLVSQLRRFRTVQQKYMSDPRMAKALQGVDSATLSILNGSDDGQSGEEAS